MAGIDDGILVKRFVEQDRDAQDLGVAGAGSDQFGRGMRNDGGRGFVVLREGALGTDQHKKPEKSSGCNGWCFHGYFKIVVVMPLMLALRMTMTGDCSGEAGRTGTEM